MEQNKIAVRKRFNDVVRDVGNRIKNGLGDMLTKNINLAGTLAVTGAVATPLTYAHFMCKNMYETGVVDMMHSPEFAERMLGMIESTGYTINWMIALPATALLGAVTLGKIGERLDRI